MELLNQQKKNKILQEINLEMREVGSRVAEVGNAVRLKIDGLKREVEAKTKMIEAANPEIVLKRGYAIISGDVSKGSKVDIRLYQKQAKAQIIEVK